MARIAIVQKALAQYRVEFHTLLKKRLEEEGIEYTLIYSKYKNADALKKDEVDLPWAYCVPGKIIKLGPLQLLWQSCLPLLKDHDLVIVEQANKNLLNYILLLKRLSGKRKFAYWGHGLNRQIKNNDLRNKFKKAFQNQCDWWFAYTEKVREYLALNDFPADKITALNNSIDTKFLINNFEAIKEEDLVDKKVELGITSENIGIYCGGIYKEKRVDFLLDACCQIKKAVPDFHLVVIGAGPDAHLFKTASEQNPWIHYLGPKFGKDKIKYFKLSKVFLMPGLVGLAILDSFALQTPLVTTKYPFHSPEIEYLENYKNGIITEDDLGEYSKNVIELLKNNRLRNTLIEGCKTSAPKYTVENMVENFVSGVLRCLDLKPRRKITPPSNHGTSLLLPQD